jgi:hypothetical protein
MEPSFVQTIYSKAMNLYRMVGKRPDPDSMEHLVPYMVATTYAVLCLLLLQLGRKTWPYYATDVATSLACVTLHHFEQPLLSFNLAIGYTFWNLIPGSLAAKDLPSHLEFMRNLKIKKPADSPTECVICWEDDQSHAEIPCGHQFCLPCIELMTTGSRFQTTCPTCRQPLFNFAERFQLVGSKGGLVCFPLALARTILHCAHETLRHNYVSAGLEFARIFAMLAMPAYLFYHLWLSAEDLGAWWTMKPVARSWGDLLATGIVFVANAGMVCVGFRSDFDRFGV